MRQYDTDMTTKMLDPAHSLTSYHRLFDAE